MFFGCSSLKELPDISKWKIFENARPPVIIFFSLFKNYIEDIKL